MTVQIKQSSSCVHERVPQTPTLILLDTSVLGMYGEPKVGIATESLHNNTKGNKTEMPTYLL